MKKQLRKFLCMIGIHCWGEWSEPWGYANHNQKKVCKLCGTVKLRIV